MSYILEVLGRGLPNAMVDLFEGCLISNSLATEASLIDQIARDPQDAGLHFDLGLAYLFSQRSTQAAGHLVSARRLQQNNRDYQLALAIALAETGKLDEAIEQFQMLLSGGPDATIAMALGLSNERNGNEEKAVQAYLTAIQIDPYLSAARFRLAALGFRANEKYLAVEQYERLVEQEPNRVDLHLTLGVLQLEAGHCKEAVGSLQSALTVGPDDWSDQCDLAGALEDAGLLRDSARQLHTMIDHHGDRPDLHLRIADVWSRLGEDNSACAAYRHAVQLHPEFLEATVKLGTQHLRRGRTLQAKDSFERAILINDQLLVAYVALAVVHCRNDQFEEAESCLELAAAIEPNSTLLYSELTRLSLFGAPEGSESTHHVDVDVDYDMDGQDLESSILMSPAPLRQIEDDLEIQLALFERLTADRPNHARFHYELAMLLRSLGRDREALKNFRQAAIIQPHFTIAHLKAGLMSWKQDGLERAVESFEQVLNSNPEAVEAHYQLALSFSNSESFHKALLRFQAEDNAASQLDTSEFYANIMISLACLGLRYTQGPQGN